MRLRKGNRGFTLIEVLVSAAILLLISTVIITAYIGCQRSFITGVGLLNLQSQSRQAMRWLRRDMKWAAGLEVSRSINAKNYMTSNNEIILRLPAVNAAGEIINSFDYVVYHLNDSDNTVLERVVEADTAAGSARTSGIYIVARDITALAFSSGGIGLSFVPVIQSVSNVSVTLNMGKQVLGGRNLLLTATSAITLRNIQ